VGIENRAGTYEDGDGELQQLFIVWARKIGLAIRTATVGTVTAYNPATQEASIRVDHLEVRKVTQSDLPGEDPNETNAVRVSAPIQLTAVPVFTYGAGDGESYLSFPVTVGCTGMLAVLDRSRDTWVNRTASVAVDPIKSAIHSMSDCVFFPGLTPRAQRITVSGGTTIAAVLESSQVYIGKEATPATSIAIAEQLIIAMDAVLAALVAAGAGAGYAGAATAQTAWNLAKDAIKSSKGKVAP
jgi:hypothetical protein